MLLPPPNTIVCRGPGDRSRSGVLGTRGTDRTESAEWDRVVTRLPNEERTTRWLVRQAMYEGQHHLGDIRRTGEAARNAR